MRDLLSRGLSEKAMILLFFKYMDCLNEYFHRKNNSTNEFVILLFMEPHNSYKPTEYILTSWIRSTTVPYDIEALVGI